MQNKVLKFSQFILEAEQAAQLSASQTQIKLNQASPTGMGLEICKRWYMDVTWSRAMQLAQSLGNGWRLPKESEWQEYGDALVDAEWILPDAEYWSSNEMEYKGSAWYYCYNDPYIWQKGLKGNLYRAVYFRDSKSVPPGEIRMANV